MEPYLPDEVKWQIRRPSRYAKSELKMTYLDKVETEAQNFLNERIKHNYLEPSKALSLEISLKEAEVLISASQKVQGLAETGELAKIHQ